MDVALTKIRNIADYQFGKGIGNLLFPSQTEITYSRNTGRIRYVYFNGERLATLRPTDGFFSLSLVGAACILKHEKKAHCLIKVRNDVSGAILEGGDVFSAHITWVDDEIRPKQEVIVTDEDNQLLAVGHTVLSAEEMRVFKRGVAVKVRKGCERKG